MNSVSTFFKIGFIEKEKTKPKKKLKQNSAPCQELFRRVFSLLSMVTSQ